MGENMRRMIIMSEEKKKHPKIATIESRMNHILNNMDDVSDSMRVCLIAMAEDLKESIENYNEEKVKHKYDSLMSFAKGQGIPMPESKADGWPEDELAKVYDECDSRLENCSDDVIQFITNIIHSGAKATTTNRKTNMLRIKEYWAGKSRRLNKALDPKDKPRYNIGNKTIKAAKPKPPKKKETPQEGV